MIRYHKRNVSKIASNLGKLPRSLPTYNDEIYSTDSVRKSFLDYFLTNNHSYIQPCKVYLPNLGSYFVNAGVTQFISRISDTDSDLYKLKNVVNSQKCIRLGGKHCDWNNVGYDPNHLSYFEMLGNWSFGGYQQKEACKYMWTYLTEVLKLPASHLYVTYFGGSKELGIPEDELTRDIWLDIGVRDNKILQFGPEHNFWESGDKNRGDIMCGYSTEIHWDYLATFQLQQQQQHNLKEIIPRCARCFVNGSSPEVVELWNCVFMKYKWNHSKKQLEDLPRFVVDTGMGLERLTTVMQGVSSIYDTDNFQRIMNHIEVIGKIPKYQGFFDMTNQIHAQSSEFSSCTNTHFLDNSIPIEQVQRDTAYRIVADHTRAIYAAVIDGVLPGKQEQEKRIRQLLYRAVRQGMKHLNCHGDLHQLFGIVSKTMNGEIDIKKFIRNEEINIIKNIGLIEKTFDKYLDSRDPSIKTISERDILDITNGKYGWKINLNILRALAKDADLKLSELSHTETNYSYQSNRSEPIHLFPSFQNVEIDTKPRFSYKFNEKKCSYEVENVDTEIIGLIHDTDNNLDGIVTAKTNMFPIRGGQCCDHGTMYTHDGKKIPVVKVTDEGPLNSVYPVHWIKSDDAIGSWARPGYPIILEVDQNRRNGAIIHHTAQHLVSGILNDLLPGYTQLSSAANHDIAKITFILTPTVIDDIPQLPVDFLEKLELECNNKIQQCIADGTGNIIEDTGYSLEQIQSDKSIRFNFNRQVIPHSIRVLNVVGYKEACCGTHAHNLSHLQRIIISGLTGVNNNNRKEIIILAGNNAQKIYEDELRLMKYCDIINKNQFLHNSQAKKMLSELKSLKMTHNNSSKLFREYVMQTLGNHKKSMVDFQKILTDACIENSQNTDNMNVLIDMGQWKKIIEIVLKHEQKGNRIFHDEDKSLLVVLPENYPEEESEKLLNKIENDLPYLHVFMPSIKDIDMKSHKHRFFHLTINMTNQNNVSQEKMSANEIMNTTLVHLEAILMNI